MNTDPFPRPFLRGLRIDEVEAAYAIYLEACTWLKEKGVKQWLSPKPKTVFVARQRQGENYGLFLGTDLVAIATLSFETHECWKEELGAAMRRRRRLGEETVAAAESFLHSKEASELFLDCGADGILPAYYGKLGYDALANKAITYPSGNTYPIVLMRKVIGPR
jgi:hypothetical protein